MDANRFDALAKALTAHPTRRAALRLLAGSVLAAGMARLGLTEAKKRTRRKKKKPSCGGAGARCCPGRTCHAGAECNEVGYCRCEAGRRNCGGECIAPGDCCVGGKRVPHGHGYGERDRDCGRCHLGALVPERLFCRNLDCYVCNRSTLRCEPLADGEPCDISCGVCILRGNQCVDPDSGGPAPVRCASGEVCCRGRCLPECPAGEARDSQTCECVCTGEPGTGRVRAAAVACCADGGPLCGEGNEAQCCAAGVDCCGGAACCPVDEGICTKHGCCRPPAGLPCCDGLNCADIPCCGPEEACCLDAALRGFCCPRFRCFGGCCGAGMSCNGDCFHATGRACCPEGNPGFECANCVAPSPGRR